MDFGLITQYKTKYPKKMNKKYLVSLEKKAQSLFGLDLTYKNAEKNAPKLKKLAEDR